MTRPYITVPKSPISNGAEVSQERMTRSGGLTLVGGVDGPLHGIVEAPNAPLGVLLADLSSTTEQKLYLSCEGEYIIDKITLRGCIGAPGTATLSITTRTGGAGRSLLAAQSLATLTSQKKMIDAPVTLEESLSAPHLYLTIANPGSGTFRVEVYGRLCALQDPQGRTFEKRQRIL